MFLFILMFYIFIHTFVLLHSTHCELFNFQTSTLLHTKKIFRVKKLKFSHINFFRKDKKSFYKTKYFHEKKVFLIKNFF